MLVSVRASTASSRGSNKPSAGFPDGFTGSSNPCIRPYILGYVPALVRKSDPWLRPRRCNGYFPNASKDERLVGRDMSRYMGIIPGYQYIRNKFLGSQSIRLATTHPVLKERRDHVILIPSSRVRTGNHDDDDLSNRECGPKQFA